VIHIPIQFECDNCGEIAEKSPSHMTDGNNYCDRNCMSEHRKGVRHSVECNYCGKEFKISPSRHNQSDNFYCKKECESKYRSENAATGEAHPNYERVDTDCDYCGEAISIIKWCYENYEHNFCGNECHYDWNSENIKGEAHPNYKDGSAPEKYPRAFYRVREEIVDSYSAKCIVCDMSQKEHRKKYNKGICVHHIDGDVYNNDRSNLTVLCQTCNSRVEHMDYRPSEDELKQKTCEELFGAPEVRQL